MVEGTQTRDGVIFAYDEWVLVAPYEVEGDLYVVRHNETVKKGTVLSVGVDVPSPIFPGDLVYYMEAFQLEKEIYAVHFTQILSYSKFAEDV